MLKIEVRLGQALRFVFDIKCIHFIFFCMALSYIDEMTILKSNGVVLFHLLF